jgi:hypothetical protein
VTGMIWMPPDSTDGTEPDTVHVRFTEVVESRRYTLRRLEDGTIEETVTIQKGKGKPRTRIYRNGKRHRTKGGASGPAR